MKKTIWTFALLLLSLPASFGQARAQVDSSVKNKIIALEKEAWQAWKDKNPAWFQKNATAECLWVTQSGVSDKSEWIRTGASACDVKSYSLDQFQFALLNKSAVVITYTATVDATCGNFTLPVRMRASVTYVNRNGRWLEAFYMEMPVAD